MPTHEGFFSVVQYCPDLDRGERANVGIVLVVPELGFASVRFSEDNEGPKRRFGADAFDDTRLSLAKRGLEGRILAEAADWRRPEDLERFGRLEGNHLLLTVPKAILVENAEAETEELYARLVHIEPLRRRRPRKPDLRAVFDRQLAGVPLFRDIEIEIPELGRFRAPYAYQNGALNLIRPEGFPIDEAAATSKANDLAVKGHLIHKQSSAGGKKQKLIVVGGFDPEASEQLKRRIDFVLREHDARLVREERLGEFVEEVRREAHDATR